MDADDEKACQDVCRHCFFYPLWWLWGAVLFVVARDVPLWAGCCYCRVTTTENRSSCLNWTFLALPTRQLGSSGDEAGYSRVKLADDDEGDAGDDDNDDDDNQSSTTFGRQTAKSQSKWIL